MINKVYIIGDSTASKYNGVQFPMTGWGVVLQKYCSLEICNRTIAGRMLKSYIHLL